MHPPGYEVTPIYVREPPLGAHGGGSKAGPPRRLVTRSDNFITNPPGGPACSSKQELSHYVFIMQCFPATNRCYVDYKASKLDFLMNFVLKKQLLADAMFAAMVSRVVAMVTKQLLC